MIHKNKKTRLVKIECDGCGEIFDANTTSMMDAVDASEAAGWSNWPTANGKTYTHHCSAKCRNEVVKN